MAQDYLKHKFVYRALHVQEGSFQLQDVAIGLEYPTMYGIFEVLARDGPDSLDLGLRPSTVDLPDPRHQATELARNVAKQIHRTLDWQTLLSKARMVLHASNDLLVFTLDFSGIEPVPDTSDVEGACSMGWQVIGPFLSMLTSKPVEMVSSETGQ